ncbi:MAG: type VI secretion system tip protein VgrG [Bacteroidota bacterium]
MANTPRTIPESSTHAVVSFDILSEGKAIEDKTQILAISVSSELNRIPIATIVVRDGNASESDFEVSNDKAFEPGKEITIKLGRDSKNEVAFKGLVVKQRISISDKGESNLIVECRDKADKMTRGRFSKYYEKQKDADIIKSLISNHGLKAKVEATQLKHEELVQYHCSDWDFMLSRAEANGMLVAVSEGEVAVAKPDTSGKAVLKLLYGATLLEFDAELDARNQWAKVKARSWDYKAHKLFEAEASSVSFSEAGNLNGKKLADAVGPKEYELVHGGHALKEELKAWADGCLMRSRLSKIRGSARILVGSINVKPTDMVEFQGVGKRFNGSVFVTGVRHELANGTWDTIIQFGLSAERFAFSHDDIIEPPASGLVPAMRGLQIGKVVKIEQDPNGEDRIQVRLPVLDANAAGVWARVSALDAGDNRGTFFRPEIDDEVIVGFVNDDPRDPIVLGMLHSSKLPAPLQGIKNTNHEKGIFTRSEMKILFNDETKTITIETPAGNSIVMDEDGQTITIKDQNQNECLMESGGITLKSPKEITVDAGAKMTLKAKTDLILDAANVKIKAKSQLSAEGATAALKAQGIAEIKGSLVKIN